MNGRKCNCRPVRQDYLDEIVWQKILELLQDPDMIQKEIDKRIREAKKLDPLMNQKNVLLKQQSKLSKAMDKLLDAYQEGLIPIDQLRRRMPEIQKRTATVEKELSNIAANELALDNRLQLLDVKSFTERMHQNITQLDIIDKRKIVKLLVKEILVGEDSIEIRHSIPIAKTGNAGKEKCYQVCTRSAKSFVE